MWGERRQPLSSIPATQQNHISASVLASSYGNAHNMLSSSTLSARHEPPLQLPNVQKLLLVDFSSAEHVASALDAVIVLSAWRMERSTIPSAQPPDLSQEQTEVADELMRLLELAGQEDDGERLPPVIRFALASLQDCVGRLERLVHPLLGDDGNLGDISRRPPAATQVHDDLVLCPLCTAASMGVTWLLPKLLALSSYKAGHAVLASRGALWSGSVECAELLYGTLTSVAGDADVLSRYVVEQTRWLIEWIVSLELASDVARPLQDPHTIHQSVVSDDGVVEDAIAPYWDAQHGSIPTTSSTEEMIALDALHLLFRVCGTDVDHLTTVVYLVVNVPCAASNGGTLVHCLVSAGFHQCLRFVLSQLELSTRTQRRSLRSVSRVHALRCDSLNRWDLNFATPLSLAIAAHDHVAARLLVLHGASTHTRAKVRADDVITRDPRELIAFHRCSHDMQRLFYPPAVSEGGGSAPDALHVPQHEHLPTFEYLDESLQRSLGASLSRSSVGELLLGVARRLAAHLIQLHTQLNATDAARGKRYESLMNTTLRSYVAALHADPWHPSIAQELDGLLRRHASNVAVAGTERRTAQQICALLNRGVLAAKKGPSSSVATMDVVTYARMPFNGGSFKRMSSESRLVIHSGLFKKG